MTNNSSLKQHFFPILLISVSAFLVYSNSLHGIWAFDDILINYGASIDNIISLSKSRIMSYLTFLINQKINAYDQFNFRVFNLLIHIANSLLVYCVAFVTVKNHEAVRQDTRLHFHIALTGALLFAVHPLNINAVAYIIQRMASLATLFVLLALLSYVFAHMAKGKLRKAVLYATTAFCIVLGILSKETGVLAIPLIFLYDYVFLSKFDKKIFFRKLLFVAAAGFAALLAASFYVPIGSSAADILNLFLNINEPIQSRNWLAADIYWSPLEHVLTEFRVVTKYLALFVLPLPELLVFDHWNYPVSKSLFEPFTTFPSMLFLFSVMIMSVIKMKKYPFLSFGILWYFIAISLESFIAVGLDLYFEHRNYLPLAGLCFGVVAQIFSFSWKRIKSEYAPWAIVVMVFLLFGGMTYYRNFVWNDPIVFWKDVLKKTGDNPRPLIALGNSSFARAYFQDAEDYYKRTIGICKEKNCPGFMLNALYRLGLMYMLLERHEEADKVKDVIGKIYKNHRIYYVLQGMSFHANHDYRNAIYNYNIAVKNSFIQYEMVDKATVLALTGESYRALGHDREAYAYYKSALEASPSLAAAYHGIAKLEIAQKRFDSAKENLNKALKFDPYNVMVLSDMAYLMLVQGNKLQDVLPYAKKAIEPAPPLYQPYLIAGTVQLASGSDREAGRMFLKAKELRAPLHQILFNMAWGYSIGGKAEKQAECLRALLKLKDVPDNIRNTANRLLSQLSGR